MMNPLQMLTSFSKNLTDSSKKFVVGSHSLFDIGMADSVFDFNVELCENIRRFCREEYLLEIDKILYLVTMDADELSKDDSHKSDSTSFIHIVREGEDDDARYIALVFFGEKIERAEAGD